MTHVGPRGMSNIPGVSRFAELNVHTYVTLNGKPGVYFFSLDAANLLAVWFARAGLCLPYHHAHFDLLRPANTIDYRCQRYQIRHNSITQPANLPLPDTPPILHYAARLDVVAWALGKA